MILLKYIIFDKVIVSSCRTSGFLARIYIWIRVGQSVESALIALAAIFGS